MTASKYLSAHDPEAEVALLGAALADPMAALTVSSLDLQDPYVPAHQTILGAIRRITAAGGSPDVVTLVADLREHGDLEKAGGALAVSALIDALPDVANVEAYLEIVRGCALRRRLARTGSQLVTSSKPAAELLDHASAQLITASGFFDTSYTSTIGETATSVADDALLIASGQKPRVALQTGIDPLDERLLIRNGQVVVVAGATSSGKSSLALQIALGVARTGKTVVIFSVEMTRSELAQRTLSSGSGIPVSRIAAGTITRDEQDRLRRAASDLAGLPLIIDDTPDLTPRDLRTRARRIQMKRGLALVVVDYLQLMTPMGRGRSRAEEVGALSREIKLAARALNIPILMLSQLSRQHLQDRRRPELRDLRESGSIENDSDAVVMLYRPELSRPETEILIRKQRQGALANIRLSFFGPTTTFKPWGE